MKQNKKTIFFLIMMLYSLTLFAKDAGDIFIITKVTDHVYIAHPGRISRINSTTTIIVSENYLTIIESQPDVFLAKQLIKEIRKKYHRFP